MNKFFDWIVDRADERSTWIGFVTVLGAVGVTLNPEQIQSIVTAGVALGGAIAVFTKDDSKK